MFEFAGGAFGDDSAAVENGDPVGEPVGLVEVLRRQQDRGAGGDEVADVLPDGAAAARVEPGGGLVEEDHLRRADEGHGQVEPAKHSAGVGRYRPARRLDEIEALEQLANALPAGGSTEVVQIGHQAEVLFAGEQRVNGRKLTCDADRRSHAVRIGSGVEACYPHLTGVGRDQRGEDPHDRRLAGAVRAEQREDGARRNGEIDAVERHRLLERLPQAGHLDRVSHPRPPAWGVKPPLQVSSSHVTTLAAARYGAHPPRGGASG